MTAAYFLLRNFFILLIIFFVSTIITSGSATGQITVDIGATADNTLYEDLSGSVSNGAGQHLFTGKSGGGLIRRGLISFRIDSLIPPCAIIQSCTLKLYMSRTISGAAQVELRKVLSSWGESSSDPIGEEGSGATAETGDATWVHRFYNNVFWVPSGGNFSSQSSASTTVDQIGFYTWTSGDMASDVQQWLDDPSSNFGWILLGNESSPASAKRFDTKENGIQSFNPVLTVTYDLSLSAMNNTSLIEGFWDGISMISDTAKVYLHNSSSPYARIDSSVGVLNEHGNMINCFQNASRGLYYAVVFHRNSINTWSANPMSFNTGSVTVYDFTTDASQAFGNNLLLKDGRYCIYGGDVTRDGVVDLSDIVSIFNDASVFQGGYVITDLNGDEFVDLSDVLIAFNNSANFVGVISP